MRTLFTLIIGLMMGDGLAVQSIEHSHSEEHLANLEDRGTVLDEDSDNSIQAEEEVEQEKDRDERRARDIEQDDYRSKKLERMQRRYLP